MSELPELMLSTSHLTMRFGGLVAVSDFNLEIRKNEIVGLIGPNGAGKTTTFYMTTGLVTPNSGSIFLNDVDITKFPVYKRAQSGMGCIPNQWKYYPRRGMAPIFGRAAAILYTLWRNT